MRVDMQMVKSIVRALVALIGLVGLSTYANAGLQTQTASVFTLNQDGLHASQKALEPWQSLRVDTSVEFGHRTPDLCAFKVTLIGSQGAESLQNQCRSGQLDIQPTHPMRPGDHYTLVLQGGENQDLHTVTFWVKTIPRKTNSDSRQTPKTQVTTAEVWHPYQSEGQYNWKYTPTSSQTAIAANQPIQDLCAPVGQTALAGHLARFDGTPLVGVQISLGKQQTSTDEQGRFLLSGFSPESEQSLRLDGSAVSMDGGHYAKHSLNVQIQQGKTNVMPQTIYLARIDPSALVSVASPTDKEVVLTHPDMPGLEVRIPKGVVLRDQDGGLVTQVSLTPVPLDRTPYALPDNFNMYFTLQPGGAFVDDPQGRQISITYPNYQHLFPETEVTFWNYDADSGWKTYGQGRVSPDGQNIVALADTRSPQLNNRLSVRQIMTFGFAFSTNAVKGPLPNGTRDGEPVDVATGIYLTSRTDLFVQDVIPIAVSRSYLLQDSTAHAFGGGWTLSYDMALNQGSTCTAMGAGACLVLSDNTLIPFSWNGNSGSSLTLGGYWYGSTIGKFVDSTYAHVNQYQIVTTDGTKFNFDGDSNLLLNFTDRNVNRVTLVRAGGTNGNITQIISPNGRFINLTYTNGLVSSASDEAGNTVSYSYNPSNLLTGVLDPEQQVATQGSQALLKYAYDAGNRLYTITDKNGNVALTNYYDACSRIKSQTLANQSTWGYNYSNSSQLTCSAILPTWTEITNPRGIVTRYSFNSIGYVVQKIEAQGTSTAKVTNFVRDSLKRVTSVTDPLGRTTQIAYDSRSNATQITGLGFSASMAYSSSYNQPIGFTNTLGNTTALQRDSNGNLVAVVSPMGNYWQLTPNSQGLTSSITSPMGLTASRSFNLADVSSISDPNGNSTWLYSDEIGRPVSLVDPMSVQTSVNYDAKGRIVSMTGASLFNQTLSYGYDGNSNLKTIALTPYATGNYTYVYDASNNVSAITDELGRTLFTGVQYDGNNNLLQSKDGKGQLTKYSFDPLDRMQASTYSDGSSTQYFYDNADRLTQVTDSLYGTTSIAWDNVDHVQNVITPYGQIGYNFDALGRMAALTYPSGLSVNYNYNADNVLTASNVSGVGAFNIIPDGDGRLSSLAYPNGLTRTQNYNASQLSQLAYTNPSNASVNTASAYSYDDSGRIISITNPLSSYVPISAVGSATYDAAGRVVTLNGQAISMDANGSQTSDVGGQTYQYDARGRLTRATLGATVTTYGYNPSGWRDTKNVTTGGTSVITHYLYDLFGHLIAEANASGVTLREYVWAGDIPVYLRVYSGSTALGYNILSDHLGTPRVITDTTVNSAVVWQWNADLYGNGQPTGNLTFNLRFAGQYYDAETGLHYNGARYYNPKTARYVQSDPLGLAAGINTYSYVAGNPLTYIDPNGLDFIIAGRGTVNLYHDNGMPAGSYPYSTGMHGNTDYTMGGIGPTPPGTYTVYPNEISPAGFFRKYIDPRDWGDYRVSLHPDNGTNTYGRGGFFIHGGRLRHGSEGCIKVEGENQNDLFDQLKTNTNPVTVFVGRP